MNVNIKATVVFGMGLICFIAGSVKAADLPKHDQPEEFRFRFELNHPLVYQVTITTKSTSDRTMQLDTGNKSTMSRTTDETRFKARFTPVKQGKDGTWTLRYEPMDFEEDTDIAGTGGQMNTSIQGLTVRSTQNGIKVVDTTKDIGTGQAKAIKQGVFPKLLSGYFDFNATGGVDNVDGDLPFIDFWTETLKYKAGFFDFTFPKGKLATGDTWQSTMTMKNLDMLKLGNDGITETNQFSRQNDSVSTTNALATISATLAVNLKNVPAAIEQMGQDTMINLSEFNHDKSTTIQFDAGRGYLTSITSTEHLKTSISMLVQAHTVTGDLDTETTSTVQLLDAGK